MKSGATNDGIVPVMHLKRFATQGSSSQVLQVAPADKPLDDFSQGVRNVGSAKGFYWGSTPEGVPHHEMESFLARIEAEAAPAFRYILDKGDLPTDSALPRNWPTRADTRITLSWWIAAQILRTARQRERLWSLQGEALPAPAKWSKSNLHIEYIVKHVAPLAFLISRKP